MFVDYKKKLEQSLRRRLLDEIVEQYTYSYPPRKLREFAQKLKTWSPQEPRLKLHLQRAQNILDLDPRVGENGAWSKDTIRSDIEALKRDDLRPQYKRHSEVLNRCIELIKILHVEWVPPQRKGGFITPINSIGDHSDYISNAHKALVELNSYINERNEELLTLARTFLSQADEIVEEWKKKREAS